VHFKRILAVLAFESTKKADVEGKVSFVVTTSDGTYP